MKFSKMIGTVVFAMGLSFLLAGVSFAEKEHHEAFIKLMNDSAAALQAAHPDLATGLTAWSNEEANEKEEKGEKKELEGKAEKEMQDRHEANLKLLRDSAVALQQSNPSLAAELTKTADQKAKRMLGKKEGKEDTKEVEEKEGK